MENLLEIYNPANAKNLTPEQIEGMKTLTDSEIEQLANAYPNQPTGNAYLVYYKTNEKADKQTFPLGTWKNLHALRKLGQKHVVPFNFKKNIKNLSPLTAIGTSMKQPKTRVVDLGKEEKIEGLKPQLSGGVGEMITIDPKDVIQDLSKEHINVLDETNPDVIAYNAAVAELEQAQKESAHHMTIKSLEKKVADAKAKAGIE